MGRGFPALDPAERMERDGEAGGEGHGEVSADGPGLVRRPDAAVESFQKALELGYRKPTTMYNLACAFAMLDRKDQAFEWLFKSLEAGFNSDGMLRSDEDLDNLRGDPRFRKALAIAKTKTEKNED